MKILFCFNRNWWAVIAKVIRFFQPLSRCSHCAILDEKSKKVIDVSFGGYREHELDDFIANYNIIYSVDIPVISGDNVLLMCRKYKNVAYGKMQLIGSLFTVVLNMKNPFKNGETLLICNEFCLLVASNFSGKLRNKLKDIEDLDLDKSLEILKEDFEVNKEG